MWHDSEVAAIAYALQNLIARRSGVEADTPPATAAAAAPASLRAAPPVMAGKKCSECGAHAVIRKDGCEYCTACGHIGACG